ncbi:hypothetical protein PH210_25945 [Paenibacillus sp. BSR1-1]|uniref:hypothetical protein n=1 Tax=Paenibacillus sp. BSR1-1 TaxID=3020845 RepID=UPI0025B26E20|nr:hypothetical protein [Paenibacillus sp. BSR1-1]MDN3019612.1 hypothetical protein [Paenibacillus sp. BSR1-1]
MFVSWLIVISTFLICLYATVIIINGLKEKEQQELAELHTQLNIAINNTEIMKQAV